MTTPHGSRGVGRTRVRFPPNSLSHLCNPGNVKPVGEGISELRIDCGPGYRVYYLKDDDELILLRCGGDKSTQDADVKAAKKIATELKAKERNNGEQAG